MSTANKKVLITGIDSFTGHHLVNTLEASGFDVMGTCLGQSNNTSIFQCDLGNKNDLIKVLKKTQPNYLIHLAGISFVGHPHPEDFYTVNVLGSQNLLDAIISSDINPEKIILASSATVYGNQGIEVLHEGICPQPANHYGMSKLSMEHMARTYFNKLPIIITRPFNYTGPGQADNFVIPKVVKHFREKARVIELGNIHVEREFNDVKFTCSVYQQLLQSSATGEIVNLCSGKGIALNTAIQTMEAIAAYSIEVKVNPAFVRKNELPRLVGSPEKLESIISDLPEIAFSETLSSMYSG